MAVDITPSALLEFAKTIKSGDQKSASSSVATVTRIDPDGVTYVSLPGGVDETPIATAGTSYNIGDVVYVNLSGGKLRANENLSSPSVGARVIKEASESLSKAVRIAKQAADEAGKVANAVNQHFWYDDNGAHVTDVTKDEWAAAVADNFSDLSADKQYPNLLENSLGILLRSALNYLVSITRSAIAFYDGLGNTASNIVAQFGTDGAQIGYVGDTHAVIDYHSMQLVDKEGNAYFHISDLRDSSGGAEIVATFIGGDDRNQFEVSLEINEVVSVTIDGVETSDYEVGGDGFIFVLDDSPADGSVVVFTYITYSQSAKAYTFGYRETGSRIGGLSTASGYELEASGFCSHAEGYRTVASGNNSHAEGCESEVTEYARAAHAEGYHCTARGDHSHAEGLFCETIGLSTHAEGYHTSARGHESHSEGYYTTANGSSSHSEGYYTTAGGEYSHAEGYRSQALGESSHAQNVGTIALGDSQTVVGTYNVEDKSVEEFTGDGSTDAFTLSGNPVSTSKIRAKIDGVSTNRFFYRSQTNCVVFDSVPANGAAIVVEYADEGHGNYAVIVGNGTADNARSNAFAIDWSGRPYIDDAPCYPCFMTTSISNFSPSISPCLVLDTSDYGLYWYTS